MLIVDAQIHLWSKGTTLPPHRAEPYLMEQAQRDMDSAGVDRALIHPPSWDPDSNELAVAAVRAHPALRDPRPLFARAPREPATRSRMEEPPRHARPAFHVSSAAYEVVADRRHHRLAVAGGREGGRTGRAARDRVPAAGRRNRAAPIRGSN